MNLFLMIFSILFFLLVLRRVLKKRDSKIIKLLCPFCDSYIARANFPSKNIYLIKSQEDLWLGSKFYAKVKLDHDLYIICPNCHKLVILEEKKICK